MTHEHENSRVYLMDCMEGMAKYPDNHFELAVVDPPYGIGADIKNSVFKKQSKNSSAFSKDYGNQNWDNSIPTDQYFVELQRVSKRQIIWGANYFGLSGGMLFWDKGVTMPSYSKGELAWLSWLVKIDYVNIAWHGMIQENMKNKENRIHPTQKPVALYDWIFKNYAKEGDKILDTHLGSQSSRISAYKNGLDFTGFELDEDYFRDGNKRFMDFTSQLVLI